MADPQCARPQDPVLILSSQVAGSRVGGGLSAASLTLAGFETALAPTVVFGRHPGLGPPGGAPVSDGAFESQLAALAQTEIAARAGAILTGYFASPGQVRAAADFIEKRKAVRPETLILVDPILGDGPAEGGNDGLYVAKDTAAAIRNALLTQADLITPNAFELAWLAGAPIADAEAARRAAAGLGMATVATSIPGRAGLLGVLSLDADGAFLAETQAEPSAPKGTGDLFAALLLAERLAGRRLSRAAEIAAVRTGAAVRASARRADLILDPAALFAAPGPSAARRIGATKPAWALGLDGCPGGWAGAMIDLNGLAPARLARFERFQEALDAPEAFQIIAVDMPIGFPDQGGPGGRACERAARALLGPRRASVFSAPTRPALEAADYRAALAANRAAGGPGLSKQGWNLTPKMVEVDRVMAPALEGCVHEAHPELVFMGLSGAPMAHPKRTPEGRAERLAVLAMEGWPVELFTDPPGPRRAAAPDDWVDAAALALCARRIAEGRAACLPAEPPRDGRGLRMAIFY